jgi:hypothetical protein
MVVARFSAIVSLFLLEYVPVSGENRAVPAPLLLPGAQAGLARLLVRPRLAGRVVLDHPLAP